MLKEEYFDIRLFEVGDTPITLATLVALGAILVITFILSRVLQATIVRALRLSKVRDEGTVAVARRLIHYVVLLAGLGVGLETAGIDLTTLFAAGALFAVAIGFAMRNIAENFVSGVILLVERAIKPGDILQVEGQLVKVTSMGIRTTICRTLDDEEIIIPNSTMVQTSVKNFTMQDCLHRVRLMVGVAYSSDMGRVRQVLEETAAAVPWKAEEPGPRILMKEFGSSSVNFDLSVWINDPWKRQVFLSDLHERVWWALKEAGVTIAFPQLDLHVDPISLEGIKRLPSAEG